MHTIDVFVKIYNVQCFILKHILTCSSLGANVVKMLSHVGRHYQNLKTIECLGLHTFSVERTLHHTRVCLSNTFFSEPTGRD